ncbi:MAG TPA: type II secretion system F family protein [Longimicrobiales bacterium]|nr:type II secretion system F family protein [Longimicrobiales bacterium]
MGTTLGAVLVFLAVAALVVFVVLGLETVRDARDRKSLASRLENMDFETMAARSGVGSDLLRPLHEQSALEAFADKFTRMRGIQTAIEQADLSWTISTYILATLGFGFAGFVAGFLFSNSLLMALVTGTVGAGLPYLYVVRKRARRMRKLEEQLPEAIDLMGRALRAGHPFSAGIKMVAEELPAPLGEEYRRAFEEQRFGLPVQDALLSLADRNPLLDVRIFVTAVLIQREVGGNLAEILDSISHTIRERFRIQREIRTRTAQGRMTGYLLAGLPIIMGILFYFLNREYIMTLFTDPLGVFFLGAALILQVIGFLWIRQVVDIDI